MNKRILESITQVELDNSALEPFGFLGWDRQPFLVAHTAD